MVERNPLGYAAVSVVEVVKSRGRVVPVWSRRYAGRVPNEPLDFQAMLAALLGLIGQEVSALIDLQLERRRRLLAGLFGELKRGDPADFTVDGVDVGWVNGESILMVVGSGFFVIREADYKRGRREDGGLFFETGRARIVVVPQDS